MNIKKQTYHIEILGMRPLGLSWDTTRIPILSHGKIIGILALAHFRAAALRRFRRRDTYELMIIMAHRDRTVKKGAFRTRPSSAKGL